VAAKRTDNKEGVQTTLGNLVDRKKVKDSKMKSLRDRLSRKKESKAPDKKRKEKKAKPEKRTSQPKRASKKASPKKEKKPESRGTSKIPETVQEEEPSTTTSLGLLAGVGKKLEEKLTEAGYDSVEQLSNAKADAVSRRVEGMTVDSAKKLIKAAAEYLRTSSIDLEETQTSSAEAEPSAEVSGPEPELTDLDGVGSKLAQRLVSAGYDSVARLSRTRPESLARTVDGLSVGHAKSLVAAAKEAMTSRQLAQVSGEPVTAISTPDPKAPEVAGEKKTSKKAKKKPKVEETVVTVHRKPKPIKVPLTRVRPVRKSSGLPVPQPIIDLAEQMRAQWRTAEKEPVSKDGATSPGTVPVANLTADETVERLVEAAIEVLNETMTTGRPSFEIPSRSADNIVWDEVRDLLLLGMRTISRPYHSLASVVDATRTARVMEIVYELLKSSLHATKREIYYSDVNLFRDQKYSDKILEDVSSMLQTTRDSVHVVAAARGSAMGRVVIRDAGDRIDLTQMGTGGWAITPFLDEVEIVESDAEFILLSEKDAAVMRLAEAKYWNRQPCIVLTGKGSGDMATRAFLKIMVKELEIPAFALMDSDPYGHYIYSVFLRGSKRLSYESPFIATPELKLLGVLSRDLDEFKIPKSVRIPMMPADIKRVKEMLKEPFVQKNGPWVQDLELMLRIKEKAEIQAFASHGFEYLTDQYIPRKLETGDWI